MHTHTHIYRERERLLYVFLLRAVAAATLAARPGPLQPRGPSILIVIIRS